MAPPKKAVRISRKKTYPLKKTLALAKSLKDVKNHDQRSELLSHFDDKTCEALYEIVHNILNSKLLPPKTLRKLSKTLAPHKKSLQYLANANSKSKLLKKKKLVSLGGNPLLAIFSAFDYRS